VASEYPGVASEYPGVRSLLKNERFELRRQGLMQEGNRNLVPGQDHPFGSLLGDQFLQHGFSCKGFALVLHTALVLLLISGAQA
jgi:hypothetical protein